MRKRVTLSTILVLITVLFSGTMVYAAELSYMFDANYYATRYDDNGEVLNEFTKE